MQGPSSRFFARLTEALMARGARVTRVTFCPGDTLFAGSCRTIPFRARPEEWPGFLRALIGREGITDIVGLGDGRYLHRAGFGTARRAGLRVHVLELGYLRPGWLTLEPDGTGGRSRLPRDPAALARLAETAGPTPAKRPCQSSFAAYAAMDCAYHLANLLAAWLLYPNYRGHALDPPLREWRGWLAKAAAWPSRQRARARAERRITAHRGPLFLLPLQLETDFQIRHHGPPGGMAGALAHVVGSFLAHAPPEALLIVKTHPLDNGLAGWRRQLAALLGPEAASRAVLLDGGRAETLFAQLSGVVTVNSTVGLAAARAGLPVATLGQAIYNLPGVTAATALTRFWQDPSPPDLRLTETLVQALRATIQVPGGFDGTGLADGATGVADKILARQDAFAAAQPRPLRMAG